MCHYTITFYGCNHRNEDNVQGCDRWRRVGTHCNIDDPAIRRRNDCSIRGVTKPGLCPRCQNGERAHLERLREEELLRRDLEKARLQEQEEQRKNAAAHEAHLRKIQEESKASWDAEFKSSVSQVMQESTIQVNLDMTTREVELLNAAIEASHNDFMHSMETRFGEYIEEGTSRLEAIMRQSTMDWHHSKWGPGAAAVSSSATAELRMKVSSSFRTKGARRTRSAMVESCLTGYTQSQYETQQTQAIPPPPPLPPALRSDISFAAPPPLALSGRMESSSHCIDANALLQQSARLQSASAASKNVRVDVQVKKGLVTPSPALPPVDYSRAPKDQNIGHYMIGTRRQPIHPSQEVANNPASPTNLTLPRSPLPRARVASTVAPPSLTSPSSPSGFTGVPIGNPRELLRSTTESQRLTPRSTLLQEQPQNELERLWSKLGIQRETEDDDDGISITSITPSESVSQL